MSIMSEFARLGHSAGSFPNPIMHQQHRLFLRLLAAAKSTADADVRAACLTSLSRAFNEQGERELETLRKADIEASFRLPAGRRTRQIEIDDLLFELTYLRLSFDDFRESLSLLERSLIEHMVEEKLIA